MGVYELIKGEETHGQRVMVPDSIPNFHCMEQGLPQAIVNGKGDGPIIIGTAPPTKQRLVSLDVFRGTTVAAYKHGTWTPFCPRPGSMLFPLAWMPTEKAWMMVTDLDA